jgi:hypothetical protein
MVSFPPIEVSVSPIDLAGFLACSLVLATFAMRSMGRLRLLAILSNLAFIYYAAALGLIPILLLHAILLPLNLWRLLELRKGDRGTANHEPLRNSDSDRGKVHSSRSKRSSSPGRHSTLATTRRGLNEHGAT